MTNKNKRIIRALLFITGLVIFSYSQLAYAKTNEFQISALDTVAGFETLIKAENAPALQPLSFTITKPDSTVLNIQAQADADGIVNMNLSEEETRVAGMYGVEAREVSASFTVFPGDMNPARSSLYSNKSVVAANLVDAALVTVRITDEFGNPLEFHDVKLTSSRSADRIFEQSSETDGQGLAMFLVSSSASGVSVFTATDESTGVTLGKRVSIIFAKAKVAPCGRINCLAELQLGLVVKKEIGGDPERILLAQAGQTVARFEIDMVPATITVNQTVTFRISAVDSTGAAVPSYTGTVIFSSTDPNADLPDAYTFQSADQGRKTFSLALTFSAAGTHKLTVQQQGNALIKGEKTIEVVTSATGQPGQVTITKPATGTYSQNTFEIAGQASPNARVSIFDNGQKKTEAQADSTGRFSYVASLLSDGQHSFQAESNGVQSSAVTITIDSTPARVDQVDITDTELAPGESTQILIRSDPDLKSAEATVDQFVAELEPDPANPGVFRGTLVAPASEGEYTINVVLVDALGTEAGAVEVGKLRVNASFGAGTPSTFSVPSKVRGVSVIPGNGRLTLTWQPAQAASGIAFYRIYYGTTAQQLNSIVNTQTSGTTWTIPNLQNGVTYYFQVVGVDTQGNEGDNRSDIVSGAPSENAPDDELPPVLCDPMPCPPDITLPPQTPEDGPEVIGMIVAAILGSAGIRVWRRKGNSKFKM